MKPIAVTGARLHNLKSIDVKIPTDKLVVVTGVSGSGKSTLVFDLLFEEGRKRYLQAIGVLSDLGEDRGYDQITGLRPAVAIKQSVIRQSNPRSVVGTKSQILHHLGMLFAAAHNKTVSMDERVQAGHFSFNSPLGMCEECQGRGHVFSIDFSVLLPSETTTLSELYRNARLETSFRKFTQRLVERFDIDLTLPFRQLPQVVQDIVLYGRDPEGMQLSGLDVNLQARLRRGKDIGNTMTVLSCAACCGSRLNADASAIVLAGKTMGDLGHCTIKELDAYLRTLPEDQVAPTLLNQTRRIVSQLIDVKLDYLSLYRPLPTLSGGELQRLFLMSYLDSDLESLLYIFDEPTAGLHEIEKQALLERIALLKEQGNAVIVVEHDPTVISMAEHIIDIGPGAGDEGGRIMYQGEYAGLLDAKESRTAQALPLDDSLFNPAVAGPTEGALGVVNSDHLVQLTEVTTNNLKSVSVSLPLRRLVGVAGVSGSGKSSLISSTLVPALRSGAHTISDEVSFEHEPELAMSQPAPRFKQLLGAEHIERCIEVGQEPIGRKSGSNPATYLGVWDRIRKLFAQEPLAKERGYAAGHFSFNASGACEQCNGNGVHQIWLGTTHVSHPCDRCKGNRYKAEILDVRYRGHTVSDVLKLPAKEALSLFKDDAPIVRVLDVLMRTGMGYISLGQPASSLSGGEAQRLKLAREIGRKQSHRHTLYVMDEPTTGLSAYDCGQLLQLIRELVQRDNTVVLIEHDPVMLSHCDWLLELGPGAGQEGGQRVAEGTPEQLKQHPKSLIGPYLQV